MKILRITANGLDLFKKEVEIDFFAEKRVLSDNSEMLTRLFNNIYTNNLISIVGVNASGKTSCLKLISFVIGLINGKPLNYINSSEVLNNSDEVSLEVIFFKENEIFKLDSKIKISTNNLGEKTYYFTEEKLFSRNQSSVTSKKDLLNFENSKTVRVRDNDEEFLQNDVSIALLVSKNSNTYKTELIREANLNVPSVYGHFPIELLRYLDPSIEYLHFDENTKKSILKFYNKKPIIITDAAEFINYLSSGTIKGMSVFVYAMSVFEDGGYLIVDELENHFNKEIVLSLLRFFTEPEVNVGGATLIFSTHYSELLDEIERLDSIYVVRNDNGIFLEKLSNILKRSDIKKSDAFLSDYLKGTAPSYKSYIEFKETIKRAHINLH